MDNWKEDRIHPRATVMKFEGLSHYGITQRVNYHHNQKHGIPTILVTFMFILILGLGLYLYRQALRCRMQRISAN